MLKNSFKILSFSIHMDFLVLKYLISHIGLLLKMLKVDPNVPLKETLNKLA